MLHLVTGGAGFVGVNLIERLLAGGDVVVALDNFVRGQLANLQTFAENPKFRSIAVDCSDLQAYRDAMAWAARQPRTALSMILFASSKKARSGSMSSATGRSRRPTCMSTI